MQVLLDPASATFVRDFGIAFNLNPANALGIIIKNYQDLEGDYLVSSKHRGGLVGGSPGQLYPALVPKERAA